MAKSKQQLKQAAKKAAASGSLTNKQVNQLQKAGVKSSVINNIKTSNAQGYSANRAQTVYNNTPASSGGGATAAATRATISNQNSLGQNLRAASGANGVLSNKELLKISQKNDKNPERVLEKAVGKGMMIGSGVVNKYQKGKYTDPRLSMARQALPGFAMAAGKDSAILQQLRNAGRQDKGSALFIGSKGSTATTLPRKLGLGKGYRPPGGDNNPEVPLTNETGTTGPETVATTSIEPILPPEEAPTDPGVGMMSGGGMGAAGANKLGRAKSRLRKLGIYGRGTGLLGRGLQYGNTLNA